VVRQVFDPNGRGELVDVEALGLDKAYRRSRELLESGEAIFEGGYSAGGASIFADVLLLMSTAASTAHLGERKSTSLSTKSPLAAPKCLTSGRVKIPHLAVAGRGMITRFDASWQGARRIL